MDDFRYKLPDKFTFDRRAHFMLEVAIDPENVEGERDDCSIEDKLDRHELWMAVIDVFCAKTAR